ncbi:hypothetical protein GDO81_023590 [Engystomops pustulosus]|uniref:Olfactory receptor n=1 Tax=Engystomops pustulosus TaxID=76066 RepID=A0AAV6ZHY3_ENGPU|nr:hypothetical protein GDO81_023590 [Engystomops pustulosus]
MGKEKNWTVVREFFLLGFQGSHCLRFFLYCFFLVVYLVTICGNLLIIVLVSTSRNLHTPMYFFISQLSISDIFLTTTISPNMLNVLLTNGRAVTFTSCMTQLYFFCASEGFECFLLAVMSYDRYVAICYPLHYNSAMTSKRCVILAIVCWFLGLSAAFIDTLMVLGLNFCGPHTIDHYFCDLDRLIQMTCSNMYNVQLELSILSVPSVMIPTIIIITSYGRIVSLILKIPSSTGKQKAFSTCSSHLIVISIFYWTMFIAYGFPTKKQSLPISKILSLLYTVFTPLINPIIYSLRNKDIEKAIKHSINKYMSRWLTGIIDKV